MDYVVDLWHQHMGHPSNRVLHHFHMCVMLLGEIILFVTYALVLNNLEIVSRLANTHVLCRQQICHSSSIYLINTHVLDTSSTFD